MTTWREDRSRLTDEVDGPARVGHAGEVGGQVREVEGALALGHAKPAEVLDLGEIASDAARTKSGDPVLRRRTREPERDRARPRSEGLGIAKASFGNRES